jgi:hypothetical protein
MAGSIKKELFVIPSIHIFMHYHTREPRAKRLSHQLLENIDISIDIRVTYITLLCTNS